MLFVNSYLEFTREKLIMHGAALSYYTVFAIVPMIVLVIGVLGIFFSEEFITTELYHNMQQIFGDRATQQIFKAVITNEGNNDSWISALVGFGILLFSSTSVLYSLKFSINQIWKVPLAERKVALKNLMDRGISFLFLLAFGLILLVSFFFEAALAAMGNMLSRWLPGIESGDLDNLHILFSLIFNTLLFFIIFKFLPDARVKSKIALAGALVTSVFFQIAQAGIDFYVNASSLIEAWGAAGSLILLLFWVFISSQVIFFGVKFTYLLAEHMGAPIVPFTRYKIWIRRKPSE